MLGFLRKEFYRWKTGFRTRRVSVALVILQILAGPSIAQDAHQFWREEQQRSKPPTRGQPVSEDYLTPYRARMHGCWRERFDRALANRVSPQDFARIIEGACGRETNDYSFAIVKYWLSEFPNNIQQARSVAATLLSDAHKAIVSLYTERWYASAQKKETPSEEPKAWSGTGFFVTAAGHLLTNAHVARGCVNPVIRTRDGSSTSASVIAQDDKQDLALLKANVTAEHVAAFRIEPEPLEGDQVTVFGFPLAGILSSGGNATFGYITATKGIGDNENHWQISAAVQAGNSGGPLLDLSGNVVGVVFAKLGLRAAVLTGDLPQNINFAVKSGVATKFLASQGIAFTRTESRDQIGKAEVVDRAKSFSVHISCKGAAPATSAAKPTDPMAELKQRSAEFLVRHYSAVSSGSSVAMQAARSSYAPSVNYFGKSVPFEQVMSELARFVERWPSRIYKIKPQSVTISCDEVARSCKAQGEVIFDARNAARGQRSFGEASFEFTLAHFQDSSSPLITVEGGKVTHRRIEAFTPEQGE